MHRRAAIAAGLFQYATAVALVAGACLLRWWLPGVLTATPYLAFYPAVAGAAMLGGVGPGVLATVLSLLSVQLLFGHPPGDLSLSSPVTLIRASLLLAGGVITSLMVQRSRSQQARQLRLTESLSHMAAIVEGSDDAITSTDAQGIIRTWNPGAQRMLGYEAKEIIGRPITVLLPPDRVHEEDEIMAAMRLGKRIEHLETVRISKEGRRVDVWATVSPLTDARGQVVGAAKILRDISERKAVDEALRAALLSAEKAKAAAEEAGRAKDHFLAVLSHELRTPLTVVLPALEVLEPMLDAEAKDLLEMVRRNVEMESRLIDDLLDLTRIARGKVELDRRPVELCTILRHAVEVCQGDIEARRLHFGLEIKDPPHIVNADAGRLQQVFWNLIKNAVKFTPHDGSVNVRAYSQDGTAVVEVTDSGVGIEPEVLGRIFNAFEQGDRNITRQFGGLGLGLAISKALVDLHGGTVRAYSDGKGKGAKFTVRLPIVQRTLPSEAGVGAARADRKSEARKLRILLVEDHGDTARILRRLLQAAGNHVEHAGDVATALELAGEQAFDLLLSDLGLPDGSGVDLMRQLRGRGDGIPGIALSGYGQEEDVRRSREAGFAMHLTKPISPQRLSEAIAELVGDGVGSGKSGEGPRGPGS